LQQGKPEHSQHFGDKFGSIQKWFFSSIRSVSAKSIFVHSATS
jgi:hypothetical protein